MGDLKEFSENCVLIIRVHDGDVEIVNRIARDDVILEKSEREYLSKRPEGCSFTFYHPSGIYRCARAREWIICMDVTDLVQSLEKERRERIRMDGKYRDMVSLSDMVIHDIKNYLFLLDGIVTIIREEGFDESLFRDLGDIVSKMKGLIRKTSLLMRDRGRVQITNIKVKELVQRVVSELEAQWKDKGISITVDCRVSEILTDPLIEEVIFNLLSNAVEHTPSGGDVSVECSTVGDRVIISVRDTGPGIPDDMKEIIFERLKSTSSGVGMGLGLAVSKHIVEELLGGRIWVEDNNPRGAVFFVELPSGK